MGSIGAPWDMWLLTVLEWALLTASLGVAGWWLIGRRGDPKRCCPACGYDMQGLATRKCPECAHEAGSERQMTWKKSRRVRLVLAVCLLLASYVLWIPGRVTREGVWAVVPTSALALATPWYVPEQIIRGGGPNGQDKAVSEPAKYELFQLLTERIQSGELGLWHWEFMSRRALASDTRELVAVRTVGNRGWARLMAIGLGRGAVRPGLNKRLMDMASIEVTTRDKWPLNAAATVMISALVWSPQVDQRDVCVRVVDSAGRIRGQQIVWVPAARTSQIPYSWDFDWLEMGLELGANEASATVEKFDIEMVRVDAKGVASAPFASKQLSIARGSHRAEDVMAPVNINGLRVEISAPPVKSSAQLSGQATVALKRGRDAHAYITFDEEATAAFQDVTVALRIEVFCSEELRFEGSIWIPRGSTQPGFWPHGVRLVPRIENAERCFGKWRVVVKSDAELALRDSASTRRWEGELTFECEAGN